MGLAGTIYQTLFRRSSTAAITIVIGAYATERIIDEGSTLLWKNYNKGKLWDDIKHKYEK
ncbi:unnamed protein product [Bemisia tabaci]|uniref:Complex III subunit 9 n=1 Tax=Bemisia tabaci TaxID=7038 RepID=A0A9P0AKG9_BEMTA|nr:PREDICTED: cytochrome b-c1 complex subunit 9 [Bemisia tabaci]CAH0394749.1 unnamed protein product [Bemisia tabaci]